LPNKIYFLLTKINNHNGNISNEVRLILLIDRISGIRLYFQYITGNIIDVSTLNNILSEAKAFKINVKHVILDAGYYSEKNIRLLNDSGIPYI
jgi:transposase